MQQLKSTEDILARSEDLLLYKKLILQLNKDFLRASINLDLPKNILPKDLKFMLYGTINKVLQEQFSEYLNLLYIIDVSEEKIKQIEKENTLNYAEQVVYLILLREWQKVWFRNKMNF